MKFRNHADRVYVNIKSYLIVLFYSGYPLMTKDLTRNEFGGKPKPYSLKQIRQAEIKCSQIYTQNSN